MKTMLRLSAVAALLAGSSLAAQESVGTVLGTIKTDKGAALEGARIQLSSPALLGGRTLTTESNGSFRMPLLPPGSYTMLVSKTGYVGSSATFRVNAGVTLRQDLTLRPIAEATAVVEVVATQASVDKTDTKTATTMSADKMAELPVAMTAQAALFLSPGVSGSTDQPSIRGGVGGSAQFTVNGISVRDNVMRYGRQTSYVIGDLTEEIQVIQNPLNARYGNASGGMVNLVTKSGTNEFQGSLRVSTNRDSWSTFNGPYMDRRFFDGMSGISGLGWATGNTLSNDSLSRRYQVTLTGPIVKDKLTFTYGRTWAPAALTTATLTNVLNANRGYVPKSVDANGSSAPIAVDKGYTWGVTDPTQVRTTTGVADRDHTDQVKLFWMINQDHQLEGYYTLGKLGPIFDNQYGNLDDISDRQQETKRTLWGMNYRALLGGGVLDVKYGQTKKQIDFPSGPGEPVYIRSWASSTRSILDTQLNSRSTSNYYLTNGDPSYSLDPELRQNDTIQVNYLWTNGTHQIDVGGEQFKETSRLYPNYGDKGRAFYMPGQYTASTYAVYNYFLSSFPGIAATPGNRGVMDPLLADGSAYVPGYSVYTTNGTDFTTRDTTTSVYVNDIWTISEHWQVMAGLRADNWKVANRRGTEVNTRGISPRFEVKYDLAGDGREVLNFSLAQFRGVIGQGNLRTYRRGAGHIATRYFWNEGAGTIHSVTKDQIFDVNNYQLFRVENSDAGRLVNPDLKPERTTQMELGYRRNFEKGGYFRATFAMSRTNDLWYRRGINELVDDNGLKTISNMLDIDPENTRNYRSIELEWRLPIYRSANSSVDLNGFWTSARNTGRVTWADGDITTAIRFDDIYRAAGYQLDDYNSRGEFANSIHNNLKAWLSWSYGAPRGIQSVMSLMGQYASGGTFSTSFSQYLPGVTADGKQTLLPDTKDTPTSIGYFMGHRGQWTQPDFYSVDYKWNLTIPVAKKVKLFTELTVNNIFNSRLVTANSLGQDTVVRGRNGAAIDPTYRIGSNANWSSFGLPSAFAGGRSYGLDFGFRF